MSTCGARRASNDAGSVELQPRNLTRYSLAGTGEGGVAVARGPGSGALVIRQRVLGVCTKPQCGSGPSASDQCQPTPVSCIVGSWRFACACGLELSYVAVTTNTVRKTKTPEQFDNEGASQCRTISIAVGVQLGAAGEPSMEFQADAVRECSRGQSGSPDCQRKRLKKQPEVAWSCLELPGSLHEKWQVLECKSGIRNPGRKPQLGSPSTFQGVESIRRPSSLPMFRILTCR